MHLKTGKFKGNTGKLETDQVECPNDEDPSFEGAAAAAVLNGGAHLEKSKQRRMLEKIFKFLLQDTSYHILY